MSDERHGIDPRNRCPRCGAKTDAATFPSPTEDPRPKAGDLSICFDCRLASVFEPGPRGLRTRPLTIGEFDALPVEAQMQLIRLGTSLAEHNYRRRSS